MVRLLLLLFAILLMVIHATSTTTQRNYLVVLLTSDGSSHDLHSLPTSSPDSSRPFRVAWTTTTGLSSIKYIDQSTFDGVANQLFAPTPSQTKSFPCLNVTTVLATLTQVWTNNTIDSSLFILIDRRLSFCISNNSLNNQWQSPQQEELMDDIMLHFKSSFNLITSPDITIPTSIRRLSTSTGGYHYRIQPNIATKVSQIIVVHHQTPYKWFEHKFNDASTITLNLYNKVIKNVVMISNNRIFASPSPTRSIEITSRQFMYTFDNPSTPVISFLVLNIDGIKPNVYAAVDQPAIRNLKFYPYIKSTRKSPLLLHNPIDGLPNYIQFTAPLQLQFKTLDLVDSVNKRVLVHIPSSKVTKEDQNQEVNYKAGPVLIPNQYFTIKLRATNALGSIYMPTNKPIQNRLIVTQQNRSAYIPCNPSLFARLRFPKIQFQKQWLSNVKDGLVTPESSRNKDLLYFKQVNSLNEGIYTCTISNRNDTIEYHPYYLIAADKFTRNRRTVEKGEYVEIRCSSKQGFAILLHNNKIIWTKSSISHQGIIGRNLTIGIQITESSNDIYTCRTIKQQSFEEDTTRILSTGTLTPRINAYPDVITAYFGEDTFLFCNSTLPVRVWRIYVDGQFLKVTKTADVMLLISAAQLANLTHYTCEAEYPSGNILRLDVPLVILDGEWTLWSPWSSCSKTCGQSFKKRRRHCLLSNGLLSNELSTKKPCKGDDISTEVCTYRGCDPSNQQLVPSSVITGNIEAIVDKKRTNISVNIVAVEKEDFTLFTIVTSKVPLQFLKHFLVILPSLSSVNWVYGKSLNSAVSRQEFKGRKFRRKMSIYYKDGFFTSTVINIAGSPMVFEASLDGFINNDQSYDLVRARRVRECFIRSNLKTLSWYLADNCSDPSSGFRDEASFTGFGSIDYDFHQEPATFLFEVGQYDILNWKDVNDSLIIEISGFIAKCNQ
ncbi:uncharacterized protein TRIADDRAFT_53333 [Trichoplax adhaerens]|uniref:Ig-like domain-containing protein n=1 Tax=Trichoplax adhaerens TaxID=10228 RepID=B3RNY1_TRIAD|nr:predicted protein [Trichoplax adhaerens]EDV27539.1 predicted protein [Trichoplax adhaerens]|eukprot:XP_002109373.1 predicted protein [Trichoplax adhaerens]